MFVDALWIFFAAAIVYKRAQANFSKGFCLAIALFVVLPPDLDIATLITVHRAILAVLFICWLQGPRRRAASGPMPFLKALVVILCAHAMSLLLSITPGWSLKDLLAFAAEIVLFYWMAGAAFATEEAAVAGLRALVYGLAVVALITLGERYLGVDLPVVLFSHFHYLGDRFQSTYPHAILLGFAMAMGMPIALSLLDLAASKWEKRVMMTIVFLTAVACFLADSRGGWIGMAFAAVISFVLGTRQTRKRCVWVLALTLAVIAVRPGIRDTIVDRYWETTLPGSYKELSYAYRWTLWYVAYSEISKSPERFLFGYGGVSTESMDLSKYFAHEEGGTATKIGYTSWDNNYASDLIEFGVVGLGLEIIIFALIMIRLLSNWRKAKGNVKGLLAGLIASCVVYLFAMSNVFIFSAQLKFLFWAVVAIGCVALKPKIAGARLPAKETQSGSFSLAS
jgi:O-antigen ligase